MEESLLAAQPTPCLSGAACVSLACRAQDPSDQDSAGSASKQARAQCLSGLDQDNVGSISSAPFSGRDRVILSSVATAQYLSGLGQVSTAALPGFRTFPVQSRHLSDQFPWDISAPESPQAERARPVNRAGRTISHSLALAGEVFLQRMKSAGVFAKGRGVGDLFPVMSGPSPFPSPPPGPCSWAVSCAHLLLLLSMSQAKDLGCAVLLQCLLCWKKAADRG